MTDMEGVAGVAQRRACRPAPLGSDVDYERSRELLTLEVAASVEGALKAGADEVVVADGHRGGGNFIPELLPANGRYVIGKGKPKPVSGLDSSFDGVMLLGYHSMSNSGGHLCHTMDPDKWDRYFVNGTEIGEIGLVSLAAGGYNVPIWIVTGGSYACEEATNLLGDGLVTARVKEDLSYESCVSMSPSEARDVIRRTVTQTIEAPPSLTPFSLNVPMTCRLEFRSVEDADTSGIAGHLRVDEKAFEYLSDSPWGYMPRDWK